MLFVDQNLSREDLLVELSVVRKAYSVSDPRHDFNSEWLRTTRDRLLPLLVCLLTVDSCCVSVCPHSSFKFVCSFVTSQVALTNCHVSALARRCLPFFYTLTQAPRLVYNYAGSVHTSNNFSLSSSLGVTQWVVDGVEMILQMVADCLVQGTSRGKH